MRGSMVWEMQWSGIRILPVGAEQSRAGEWKGTETDTGGVQVIRDFWISHISNPRPQLPRVQNSDAHILVVNSLKGFTEKNVV